MPAPMPKGVRRPLSIRRHANCLLARFVETFPQRILFRPVQVAPHSEWYTIKRANDNKRNLGFNLNLTHVVADKIFLLFLAKTTT